ncbi:MAG: divalent-cation tolerance protein CutA [Capsulimonadaceae bacterium]
MQPDEFSFVYVTTADIDEARRIGALAVERRLAACANVLPGMESVYRWKGAVETARECVLILKTRRTLVDALTNAVRDTHSYECPCIVALPVEGGNAAFLDWIAAETERPSE